MNVHRILCASKYSLPLSLYLSLALCACYGQDVSLVAFKSRKRVCSILNVHIKKNRSIDNNGHKKFAVDLMASVNVASSRFYAKVSIISLTQRILDNFPSWCLSAMCQSIYLAWMILDSFFAWPKIHQPHEYAWMRWIRTLERVKHRMESRAMNTDIRFHTAYTAKMAFKWMKTKPKKWTGWFTSVKWQ